MTSKVTQCPKCHTSFRVTDAQLGIANGAVRCGSCLHIFNAPEHWIHSPVQASPEKPSILDQSELSPSTQTDDETADLFNDTIEQEVLDDIFDDDIFADDQDFDLLANRMLSEQEAPANPTDTAASTELADATDDADALSDELNLADLTQQDSENDKWSVDDLDLEFEDLQIDDLELGEVEAEQSKSESSDHHELATDDPASDDLISDDFSNEDLPSEDLVLEAIDSHLDHTRSHFSQEDALVEEDELISDNYTGSLSIINTDDDLKAAAAPGRYDSNDSGSFSDLFLELDQKTAKSGSVFKELNDIGGDEESEAEEAWARKLLEEEEDEENSRDFDNDSNVAAENHEKPSTARLHDFDDLFESLADDHHDPLLQDILNERSESYPSPDKANTDNTGQQDNNDFDLVDSNLDEAEQFSEHYSDNYGENYAEEEFVLGNESLMAGERIGIHRQSLLDRIEPEPVVMTSGFLRQRWIKRAWTAGIVVAVLVLAGQYLMFNFDRLARDDNYRPALGQACQWLGCQLPERDDLSQIRSSNLVVRSHPRASNALAVDAILINRADFKQHFPIMELQFTDLSGDIIAGRRFTPDEYLSGELSGMTTMPVRQPVHVSLEIVDPGEKAVNYQLYFHPWRAR